MKYAGWFVLLATVFYVGVVAIFWPTERSAVVSNQPQVTAEGYGVATVEFSDVSVRAKVPTTTALQQRGLAGQTRLSDTEGMVWNFTTAQRPAFWMKDMLIPLDFIWIREGMVVEVTQNVPPPATRNSLDLPIYEPNVLVDAVLEASSGFVQRHAIHVGDAVRLDIQ